MADAQPVWPAVVGVTARLVRCSSRTPSTISVPNQRAADPPAPSGAAGIRDRYVGVALMLGSGLSNQVGAATGALASYILLNRVIGRRLPGALGYAAAAGILSSAVPFLADLLALRRVPARFLGVFMSVNPVLAAWSTTW